MCGILSSWVFPFDGNLPPQKLIRSIVIPLASLNSCALRIYKIQMGIILSRNHFPLSRFPLDGNRALRPTKSLRIGTSGGSSHIDRNRNSSTSSARRVTLPLFRFWSSLPWLKILIAVLCFVMAIIMFTIACFYENELKIQGIFLDYATMYLDEHPTTFIYIPLYLIFTLGMVALTVWQHCCFISYTS